MQNRSPIGELVLRGQHVEEANYAQVGEANVVTAGIALRVGKAQGLVDVVVEIGARADQNIDQAVLDEIDQEGAHAGGDHGPCQTQEDGAVVL